MRRNLQYLTITVLFCLALSILCAALCAQSFSQILSFQGRLADSGTGKPLADGQYQVTFKIYDAASDGSNLWQETQTVDQVGGVFSVYLGSVNPFPGELFADGDRWLALQVSGDPEMTERFQFTPSPWALYSASSGPDNDWSFSGADIYRATGDVGIGTNSPSFPLHVFGNGSRAVYIDHNGATGSALLAESTRTGVCAYGGTTGLDAYTYSPTGHAVYAFNEAESGSAYAIFGENNSPDGIAIYGQATNGDERSTGIGVYGRSDGDYAGTGVYGEATNTGTTYGVRGVSAHGIGVRGEQTDSGNNGRLGTNDYGVEGFGSAAGGYFEDTDGSGKALVGVNNVGIEGYGSIAGGFFRGTDASAHAWVATGDIGIEAYAYSAGGHFFDLDSNGEAYVGYGNRGIEARGSYMGGCFEDTDGTSYACLAYATVGISASGATAGGYLYDQDRSGYAWVGYGDTGIEAAGSEAGGYFSDSDDTGYAYVGYGDTGIEAHGGPNSSGVVGYGGFNGGYFEDTDDGTKVNVATGTYKILGTGSVSFVQNHPEDADRVIVYACPEGDEVATYTRGTARLVNGRARVLLGETFKWVTNPEIGLTAHLTPRGKCEGLYVESLTTDELVVGELHDGTSEVAFDYIVYGLRIGFEEVSIVQEKEREAHIPSMENHRALYERNPELRDFNALERFKRMRAAAGEAADVDLTASQELRDSIVEFDPAIHGIDVAVE